MFFLNTPFFNRFSCSLLKLRCIKNVVYPLIYHLYTSNSSELGISPLNKIFSVKIEIDLFNDYYFGRGGLLVVKMGFLRETAPSTG